MDRSRARSGSPRRKRTRNNGGCFPSLTGAKEKTPPRRGFSISRSCFAGSVNDRLRCRQHRKRRSQFRSRQRRVPGFKLPISLLPSPLVPSPGEPGIAVPMPAGTEPVRADTVGANAIDPRPGNQPVAADTQAASTVRRRRSGCARNVARPADAELRFDARHRCRRVGVIEPVGAGRTQPAIVASRRRSNPRSNAAQGT